MPKLNEIILGKALEDRAHGELRRFAERLDHFAASGGDADMNRTSVIAVRCSFHKTLAFKSINQTCDVSGTDAEKRRQVGNANIVFDP